MATFQSQLNILAAVNSNVHKRIVELENNQISVKYNEESTEFYMGSEMRQIKYLGYKAYDAILMVNDDEEYHLMDYTGKCEKIENNTQDNQQNIKIYFDVENQDINKLTNGRIFFDLNNTISMKPSKITTEYIEGILYLSSDNIFYYNIDESTYGFIKLINNSAIEVPTTGGDDGEDDGEEEINELVCTIDEYIKYESTENYESIKFIDLKKPIADDEEWTLP